MLTNELSLPGTEPSFERLAEHFIGQYTESGDLVLDPFAGSGVTIEVARRLGRRGLGVEIVPELVDGIRDRLGTAAVLTGDTRAISTLDLPPAELVMTSPPFMTMTDHPQNPLAGYQTLDGDYQAYLTELARITVGLTDVVRPGRRVVLNVWNFHYDGHYTPLAGDVERALEDVVEVEQRVRVTWTDAAADSGPDDDICLVCRAAS